MVDPVGVVVPGLLDHVCLVCPVGLVGPQRLVDPVVIVAHQRAPTGVRQDLPWV